jgi:hypothetical protein
MNYDSEMGCVIWRKSAVQRVCSESNSTILALCGRDEVQVSVAEFRRDLGGRYAQLSRTLRSRGRECELTHPQAHDHDTALAGRRASH